MHGVLTCKRTRAKKGSMFVSAECISVACMRGHCCDGESRNFASFVKIYFNSQKLQKKKKESIYRCTVCTFSPINTTNEAPCLLVVFLQLSQDFCSIFFLAVFDLKFIQYSVHNGILLELFWNPLRRYAPVLPATGLQITLDLDRIAPPRFRSVP